MARTVEAAVIKGVGLGDSASDARTSQRIDDASTGKDAKVCQLLRGEANRRIRINTVRDAQQA